MINSVSVEEMAEPVTEPGQETLPEAEAKAKEEPTNSEEMPDY